MTVFKIFIVVAALLFCPSLGAGYNCTRRYQRLLREAAVVKAHCPHAAFHDCCQVRVFALMCSVYFCEEINLRSSVSTARDN